MSWNHPNQHCDTSSDYFLWLYSVVTFKFSPLMGVHAALVLMLQDRNAKHKITMLNLWHTFNKNSASINHSGSGIKDVAKIRKAIRFLILMEDLLTLLYPFVDAEMM